MQKIILKKCKSLILVLLIVPMLMISYNSQRANAVVIVDDVAEATVVALVGTTLCAYGIYSVATMTPAQRTQIAVQLDTLADDAANFRVQTLDDGRTLLTWTAEGLANLKAKALSLYGTNQAINIGTGLTNVQVRRYAEPRSLTTPIYTNTVPNTVVSFKITDVGTGNVSYGSKTLTNVGDVLTSFSGWSDSTAFVNVWDASVSGSFDIMADIEVTGSICADNVLNRDKINSLPLDSIPYGIPVANTGSADAPVWSPTAGGSVNKDVFPSSGKIADIPDTYKIPDTAKDTNVTNADTTTGDKTSDGTNTNTGDTDTTTGVEVEISWPSSPHANATDGHWETILDEVNDMCESGKYDKIYVNKGIGNEIPGAKPNNRPDVMGVRTDGKIDQVEVPSKTDNITDLIDRMKLNQQTMGDRAGDIKIRQIDVNGE